MPTDTPRNLSIGDRIIGPGQPVFVIAEIANNHNGSVERAKELVDVAVAAGADVAKFQKRTLEELYTKDFLDNPNKGEHGLHYMLPLLEEFELSMDQMRELKAYCDEKGIMFMVTPWDKPSCDFVDSLNVSLYKVGSPDMTNLDLIEYVVSKGKPLIISTGMSTEEEVIKTLNFLEEKKASYAVLHCNSTYPAPVDQLNLRYIERLRELTAAPVGFSGHEIGTVMGAVAVALGATVLERHITLDHAMEGPDHAASLEPQELKDYIKDARDAELALGSRKKIFTQGEVLNREVLGKSIAAREAIAQGTTITREMIQVIGPGKGLSPQHIDDIVGAVAEHEYAPGEFFTEEFLPLPEKLNIHSKFTWGFKGRFETIDELVDKYQPDLFEFHLSDEDAHGDWVPKRNYQVGLILHATEYIGRRMVDMCTDDKDQREASRKLIQTTLEKAEILAPYFEGTPAVIVHVGGMTVEPKNDAKSKAKLLSNLKKELEKIKPNGITFYLENLPPRPWYFGGQWIQNVFSDGWEIAEFLKETGYDFCFDSSHAQLFCNVAHKDLAEYARVVQPWTKHLHISDAAGFGGEGLQIGDGEVDFEKLFKVLRKNPCGIIPEVWRGHLYHNRGHIIGMERLAKYIALQ
jgi:sialic acid synthase SpsE/sugar phosphate isomerase/epimerase